MNSNTLRLDIIPKCKIVNKINKRWLESSRASIILESWARSGVVQKG
uniref:Uncharacterized protein n=1 Tax=Arundo donax TaxID=35708 RepID=A0A0A9GM12_ARUDO